MKKILIFATSGLILTLITGCSSTSPDGGKKDQSAKEVASLTPEQKNCVLAGGGFSLSSKDEKSIAGFVNPKLKNGGFKYTDEELEALETNLSLDKLKTSDERKYFLDKIFACFGGENEKKANLEVFSTKYLIAQHFYNTEKKTHSLMESMIVQKM